MKKTLFVLTLLWAALFTPVQAQQSNWDAATFEDLCILVLNQGYEVENVMGAYTHVNNLTLDDGYGFASLYALNARVDYNGNLLGLTNGGVSNIVIVLHNTGDDFGCAVISNFFSTANAAKFRQQMLDLGFKKTKTQGTEIHYTHSKMPGFKVVESKDRMGKYSMTCFAINPQ
jgi:hypothetical protein